MRSGRTRGDWLFVGCGVVAIGFGLATAWRLAIHGTVMLSTSADGVESAHGWKEALPFIGGLVGVGAFAVYVGLRANYWRAQAAKAPRRRRDPQTGKLVE